MQNIGPETLYIWGEAGNGLKLPNGVGFPVGKGTRLTRLALQVHIKGDTGNAGNVVFDTTGLIAIYEYKTNLGA